MLEMYWSTHQVQKTNGDINYQLYTYTWHTDARQTMHGKDPEVLALPLATVGLL